VSTTELVRKAPRRDLRDGTSRVGWGLLGLASIVAAWQLAVWIGGLPPTVLPSPAAVVARLFAQPGLFVEQGLVTLGEILVGFLLAGVIGVLLGVLIALSSVAERLVYPVLIVSQAVPKVAVAPLFVIWFGFGREANIIMAVVVAVFPIIINTALGISSLGAGYIRLGRAFRGTTLRIFWKIRFPAALPSIFAGLKLGITLATIGAVVGEFLAGQTGLGYLTNFAAGQLDTELAFAAILALSVLGVALFYAVVALESLVVRWEPSNVR
jgi:NitT/TauT family transport system permease protein